MNLRYFVKDNCRLARAQAALVAMLYVFLCTFGTLTHVHTPDESQTASPPQALVTASSVHTSFATGSTTDRSTLPKLKGTGISHATVRLLADKSALHCSFCDWQANSIARIVLPLHLTRPDLFICFYLPTTESCAFQAALRAASRAPPVA